MTAYVLAGNATLRDIGNASIWGVATARTGGDTVDTNGFKLTIDQDSRYGLSGTTSTTWGNLTISATKGGEIHVDATKVWLIPYTTGSGTLTAGTSITLSGITCNTIGLYTTALTAAPVLTGVATGYLKVTNASGQPPSSGTFTQAGFTFTISGAPIVGFIEVNGDEASTLYANRLGTFRVTGQWFKLGTTSGVSNQTLQIPNNGAARYVAGVYIEKTAGLKDYEFYPNAGTTTTTGTEDTRGKVVWIDATGLVRIGNSGAATNGYTPPSGLEVVVPNIFFENNTTAARTANVIPNATIATRYDITSTGGGVLEIDKANFAWYFSISQAYSCNVSNSCFVDAISLAEVAAPMTFTKVGVGNKPTTALLVSPLTMSLCFAGGTFTNCVWARVSMAASGAHTNTLTDISGFTFVNDTIRANTIRANATTYAVNATRVNNCTWTSPIIIQGAFALTTCNNITITDTVYCGAVSGTTVTTYAGYVWYLASNTINCIFSGLTLPVTNTQPYTALLYLAQAGCSNIKMRNIGTYASPLNLGSTNAVGLIYTFATGAAASNIKVQRVYCSNTRTGIMTGDNSSTGIVQENVFGDYADANDVMACLNMSVKGMGGTGSQTAQTAVYGSHWRDLFISATVGRLYCHMNEPTTNTSSYISLADGAAFTAAGGLYMPVIGQSATLELDYYCIGHTGFSDTAIIMGNSISTRYNYNYSIDLNDGNGFSTMTTDNYTPTTLGTSLSTLVVDAAKGFKLRLKITTITTNTTPITYVYVTTTSSATAQQYQYPLDINNITFTGLPTGTDVVVLQAGTETILDQADSIINTYYSFKYSGAQNIDVGFIKGGYVPKYIRDIALTTTDSSIPVSLTVDRNYA